MRSKVLVDMCGVCMDMLGALHTLLPEFKPENVETYDFHGNIGVDRKRVFEVFDRSVVYNIIQPYPWAKNALSLLRQYADCEAYTLIPSNPMIIGKWKSWLRELGLSGDVKVTGNKEKLEGYDAVFEDCPKTVEMYRNTGTMVYLISHRYNLGVDCTGNVVRCENLEDAVNKFVKGLQENGYRV